MDSNAKGKATGRSHPRPQAVLMGNARFHARGTWPPPPPQAVTVGMGRGRWSSIAHPCPHAATHTEGPDFVPPKSHARPRDLGACGVASHTQTSLPPSAGQRHCYAPCCFQLRGSGWAGWRHEGTRRKRTQVGRKRRCGARGRWGGSGGGPPSAARVREGRRPKLEAPES